jgi:hypothetical protein
LAVHEWLGIGCAALVIVHLLLNWQWIVSTTKKLFAPAHWQTRLGYVLNVALFVDVTLLIFTGLMISEVALRSIGISLPRGGQWRGIHSLTSDVFVLIVGAHLALHWDWIVRTVRRMFGRLRVPRLAAAPVREEMTMIKSSPSMDENSL